MSSINFWTEPSILVTRLALCRNTGSGKVRICKTAMLPELLSGLLSHADYSTSSWSESHWLIKLSYAGDGKA